MTPERLNNVVGLETYRLSMAEQALLDVLDGTPIHDMEDCWHLDYISALREHTRYDTSRAEWVGISTYPQWLSLNLDQ